MSRRIDKFNQLLLQELAYLIQKEFTGKMITVTDVETALDLKTSKVWVSVYQGNNQEILRQLQDKAPYFQSYLGKKLFIKNIPKLSFLIDKSPERVAKIEELLRQ